MSVVVSWSADEAGDRGTDDFGGVRLILGWDRRDDRSILEVDDLSEHSHLAIDP